MRPLLRFCLGLAGLLALLAGPATPAEALGPSPLEELHPAGCRCDAVPHLSAPLEAMAERLADLLQVVRNHVYHPDFGGSFSLKCVLPALVLAARYAGLAIAEGETASLELARLLFHADTMAPAERERV